MSKIDSVELARALIRCPSITPAEGGALDLLQDTLQSVGFACTRLPFEEEGAERVDNLFARWGDSGPVFCYAGHTDVVPTGDLSDWQHPPFSGELKDGMIWGRGAADMKGSIAAFTEAAARVIANGANGSIILLITGDEEGPAVNGTKKMLRWVAENNHKIDHCLVGEPSSNETLGDMIKVGRRGSMNCWLTVFGAQGHVAYPHHAQNPIPALLKKLLTLSETPLDDGYERFQPSSLQLTDIHVGNPAHNVIPAKAAARFNVRFNPNWRADTLESWLRQRLDEAATQTGVEYELSCICSGEAFLTKDQRFLDIVTSAIKEVTGQFANPSTSGGTSDARYIKDYAPAIEFGLVGKTIHKVNEAAPVADIKSLTLIYETMLEKYFFAKETKS